MMDESRQGNTASSLMTMGQALDTVIAAWPTIRKECLAVLGGELHYQAVVYHSLRVSGVPRDQIGMNVKQWIGDPVTPLFQEKKLQKKKRGVEPTPDVVLFAKDINADWRRRKRENTLRHMLLAIEIKVSERERSRLPPKEVTDDIQKLAAHREEVIFRGGAMQPVMMVIDTAPLEAERMRPHALAKCRSLANELGVHWFYMSPVENHCPSGIDHRAGVL